ncbi:triose-phosphate isomerase [Amphibiibacter pelophylacis]|uniref:Triose-phosphate isomerase n=1 Tax=Amphibiibacter pelophylacis TaxID=1799477 RepID=A0ACC6NZX8_9BURK
MATAAPSTPAAPRRKCLLGNWKMNASLDGNAALLAAVGQSLAGLDQRVQWGVAVPAPYLAQVRGLLDGTPGWLGAQDCSAHEAGAYTGETSAAMLREFGCRFTLVGHSERRSLHGETSATVAIKARQALALGLTPVVCVGETLAEREAGQTFDVVKKQLSVVIHEVGHCVGELIVAYEPVWAIGTGLAATAQQAQEVHAALRAQLAVATPRAAQMLLLYGGSMKPSNAAELLSQPDIDGGLIGGASLVAPDFAALCQAAASALAPQ